MIAADRSSAVPLLRCNISEYVSGRDKLTRNKESVESGPSAINQSGDCHHDKIKESCCNFQVVEFDWQQSFNAHRAGLDCESDGSLSTAPTDQEVVLSALQNFYKLRQLTTTASNLPQEGQSQTVGNYALLQPDYPDLIVCSDCVYATASVEPLLHALSWVSKKQPSYSYSLLQFTYLCTYQNNCYILISIL